MAYIPIVVFYTFLGIGAGIRYIYFLSIGKRKKYNDLIAPDIQTIWNFLLSIVVIGIVIFLVNKYDVHTTGKRHPPLEILMNREF
ncbi:MAG: hypothetical protein QM660_05705 [Dysgonomonas sp.]